jgi:peroxiredoxin Q/BCP
VFYFYPADLTGGCTKQACTYRDAMEQLTGSDVEVVGISGDTVENHQVFKKEHNLNFTLLADPEGTIAKAFGVKTGKGGSFEKMIQGEPLKFTRGITANRWTFVVDKNWRVAYVNTSVNPEKDAAEVMKVVEKLGANSDAAPSAVLQ